MRVLKIPKCVRSDTGRSGHSTRGSSPIQAFFLFPHSQPFAPHPSPSASLSLWVCSLSPAAKRRRDRLRRCPAPQFTCDRCSCSTSSASSRWCACAAQLRAACLLFSAGILREVVLLIRSYLFSRFILNISYTQGEVSKWIDYHIGFTDRSCRLSQKYSGV